MIALYIFPLSVAIITPLCCLVPYLLAVYYRHIQPFLPYISDTGGILPESSIFSQLLDINAIMISFTVFIRYKQLKIEIQNQKFDSNPKQTKRIEFYNSCCLYLGYLIGFGAIIIGNYRMTEILLGHGLGVFVAFGCACLYLLLMGYLTLKLSTNKFTEKLGKIRLLIAFLAFLFIGLMFIFGYLSFLSTSWDKLLNNKFRHNWSVNESGYVWHCLSSLFEWLAVLTLTPYFATFIPEFKNINWKYLRQTNAHKPNDTLNTDNNANQMV